MVFDHSIYSRYWRLLDFYCRAYRYMEQIQITYEPGEEPIVECVCARPQVLCRERNTNKLASICAGCNRTLVWLNNKPVASWAIHEPGCNGAVKMRTVELKIIGKARMHDA